MKSPGVALVALALSVIVILAFICPLMDGSARPVSQKLSLPSPQKQAGDVSAWAPIRWIGAWLSEDASRREANAQLAALQVTQEWIRINATPTPLPTLTPTPEPTSTPEPTPTMAPTIKGMIKDTGDTVGMVFWGVFWAVVIVVSVSGGLYLLLIRLGPAISIYVMNRGLRVAISPTGDAILHDPATGETRNTRNMVGAVLQAQPNAADDLIAKLDRTKTYFATGQVTPVPDRRVASSDAPDATAGQHTAVAIAGHLSAGIAAALRDTLSPEERRLKLQALALMRGHRAVENGLMNMPAGAIAAPVDERWQPVPPDVALLEGGRGDPLHAAQTRHAVQALGLQGEGLEPYQATAAR